MRRWSFASSWIAPVFFTACVVSACQGSAPERHAESASAVEPMSSPEPIDLDGAVWREVAAPYAMHEHTATVLHDGRILVAGGIVGTGQVQETTNASYVFDPVTETWTSPIPMKRSRAGHAAFRNGSQVYVVGGVRRDDQGQEFLDHVEAFYPSLTWFNVVLSPLSRARAQATATALLDGSFLIVGGYDEDGQVPAVDLFNPRSDAPWLPEGRVGHTAVTLPNGSVLVTGGEDAFFNRTSTNFLLSDLENGDWEQAAGLMQARAHHTATVLADGRVLVAGGRGTSYWPTSSVELLGEPLGGPIVTAPTLPVMTGPSMNLERAHHTAGLLPDGRVLVIGGQSMNDTLDSTEIYDPKTNEWSLGPTLNVARAHHEMVVLPARVIVFGGRDRFGQALASVEVLEFGQENGEACSENDECLSGHCVDGVCCDTACEGACVACSAALKGSGADGVCETVADETNPRSLCTEGMVCQAGECALPASCPECEDLGTTWRLVTAPMETYKGTATGLEDGSILVTGYGQSGNVGFLFTPGADTWTPLPALAAEHYDYTATKLLDGRVLVMGGYPAASELFDPATSDWTYIGQSSVSWARYSPTDVLLPDGRVFILGGLWEGYIESAEIYDPSDGTVGSWSAGPALDDGRAYHTLTVLPNGAVLLAGGENVEGATASTYVLEAPYADSWLPSTSLHQSRSQHTATLLPDGRVLIVGGFDSASHLASAEIVEVTSGSGDPTTLDIDEVAPMRLGRAYHTAGLLPDGRVIVVGGSDQFGETVTTEIYDPQTNVWKFGPSLNVARTGHKMVVLPHHIVVVGGGEGAEVLDLLKSIGATCTADAECSSGYCVDGVCCDTSCEGACVACTAALKGSGDDGVCATVVDGTNPRSECAEDMSCQAGQCALPSPCAGQADGTECGDGMVCQGGECVAAPAGCENEPDGTICDEGDGCTVGLCRDGACVETYKLDGTRCEGGICIAGECRLDRVASPPSGGDDQGPGSGGEDPSDQDPDGRGASGDADGDDAGGGCSLAPSTSGASTFATSLALLGAIGMLRRRRAAEG